MWNLIEQSLIETEEKWLLRAGGRGGGIGRDGQKSTNLQLEVE